MYQPLVPRRYMIASYTFLGFTMLFYLRANLSIAIVEMTAPKNITESNITVMKSPEFNWTTKEKGFILSSFSYGYVFAPFGGMLASKYGGATIFGLGVMLTAVLTVLSPLFFKCHYYIFIIARTFEGIFEAWSMASSAEIYARWAPPEERARIIVFSHAGVYFGTAMNYPVSGYIAKLFGWKAIFYVSGGVAFLWYVLWVIMVRNDPQTDKSISETERNFLREKIVNITQEKLVYPWKKIFTSVPVWAYLVHKCASAFGFVFAVFCLPLYIGGVHDLDIKSVGILSGIPNFCTIMSQPLAAITFDLARKRNYLSITSLHKVFTCSSYIVGGLLFIVVGSWTNFVACMICFSIFRFASSFGETSYSILPVDISPRYAGLVAGMGSTMYSIGSLFSPILLGYIVTDLKDYSLWNYYFLILSGIYLVGGIFFFFFCSGELQQWPKDQKQTQSSSTDFKIQTLHKEFDK